MPPSTSFLIFLFPFIAKIISELSLATAPLHLPLSPLSTPVWSGHYHAAERLSLRALQSPCCLIHWPILSPHPSDHLWIPPFLDLPSWASHYSGFLLLYWLLSLSLLADSFPSSWPLNIGGTNPVDKLQPVGQIQCNTQIWKSSFIRSQPWPLIYVLSRPPSLYMAELSHCYSDHKTHNTENIFLSGPSRKICWPISYLTILFVQIDSLFKWIFIIK